MSINSDAELIAQSPIVQALLRVADAAYLALDNAVEEGERLSWNREDFDRLSSAMDALEALPDWKQFPLP